MNRGHRKNNTHRVALIILALVMCLLAGCGKTEDATGQEAGSETVRWQDYNGKRIGVLIGPLMEDAAAEFFPDSEYFYYNSYPDCIAALFAGKIDAFLGDEPGMKALHAEQPEIDYIHDNLTANNYSFAFRKDDPESEALRQELNDFLARSWEDGTMQELDEIWFGVDEDRKVVDMSDLTGENGTIKVVTTSTDMPFSYIKDGKNVGYDIDLVVRFCRERGYALELGDVDFAGRIPALQSGKFDFTTDMNVTPEREEQVLFSDPTSHGGIVLAVQSSDLIAPGEASEEITKIEQLNEAGRRIGVLVNTSEARVVEQELPLAELVYYKDDASAYLSVEQGKIDAFIFNKPSMEKAINAGLEGVHILDGSIGDPNIGAVAFTSNPRIPDLKEKDNAFLKEWEADGTKDDMVRRWIMENDETIPEIKAPENPEMHIVIGTTGLNAPFTFYSGTELNGYDIELAYRFAAWLNASMEWKTYDYEGIIAAAQSGDVDCIFANLFITPERAEALEFSDPTYIGEVGVMVRTAQAEGITQETSSGLQRLKSSFEKTFVREGRWKLFVQGIGTTILIAVLAILFGTALGFFVFMLCRNGNPIANGITRFAVWLVQGMPVVVLLMILYYIVFQKVSIPGTAVSVVGFTLVFGSAVYGMLRAGVGAVDPGQLEAAYSLGYANRKAFYRVVLPQALPHFMPAYKGEITSLIKATAVVGYVAVQDLTKMGDIVRSRTYEAFFPLIAVAILYFVLAAILIFIVNKIELRIDPRQRTPESILKDCSL